MKKNILQTFEEFLREPLTILKKTIITITGIDTQVVGEKSISVQTTNEGFQITVVNSPKAYKLLSSVAYKRHVNQLRQILNENSQSEIPEKLTGPQIVTNSQHA